MQRVICWCREWVECLDEFKWCFVIFSPVHRPFKVVTSLACRKSLARRNFGT